MKELVEDLIKSRLKEEQYPFLSDINQPTKKYIIHIILKFFLCKIYFIELNLMFYCNILKIKTSKIKLLFM